MSLMRPSWYPQAGRALSRCMKNTMIHFSSAGIQTASAFFHVLLSELRGHEERLMLMRVLTTKGTRCPHKWRLLCGARKDVAKPPCRCPHLPWVGGGTMSMPTAATRVSGGAATQKPVRSWYHMSGCWGGGG